MNDISLQLRDQIPWSTDPYRLERMAYAAEGRTAPHQVYRGFPRLRPVNELKSHPASVSGDEGLAYQPTDVTQ